MSLSKIWLILRSEFWRRVRSKAFVLATLLVPFGAILVLAAPALFGYLAEQTDDRTVAVMDETGRLADSLVAASGERLTFRPVDLSTDSVRSAVRRGQYDGYLRLPASLLDGTGEATYYSMEGGGLSLRSDLDSRVNRVLRRHRLETAGASADVLSIVDSDVALATRKLSEGSGTTDDSTLAYTAIGYVMALVIYFAVFFYGQYVMQGVIEEKSSRVVEVIVSSVRPFELLMGKVLGIGAMGLAQMVTWAALAAGGMAVVGPVLALFFAPSDLGASPGASPDAMREAAGISVPTIPLDLVVWFILFFVGGFLLYASLFAAVGSAVEQQQDAQNLLLPVMTPLILPILFLVFIIESPNATVSVVTSIIPFFSPILMVLRMAITTVPLWEIVTAFVLLVGTFVGMIWVAGRIYRVGILSYGKTPSLREIARWATYR
ncbi:MAG: ABC transporter permease [Salinibacter sp.]|uniref:ABC transporter permease n=1 Tax=Salinibacter sp. TaxID=2065818 RepID=UPI002FC36E08